MLRTARANGKPPTLWLGAGKSNRWSEHDLLLSLALTAYEEGLCPGCGKPKHEVYNPDADGWYEAREDIVCAGCAARERLQTSSKTPEPGRKVYVADTKPPGLQLRPWSFASAAQPDANGQ